MDFQSLNRLPTGIEVECLDPLGQVLVKLLDIYEAEGDGVEERTASRASEGLARPGKAGEPARIEIGTDELQYFDGKTSNMDMDDMEIDPALAAAMGFSGFGTQPNAKKRKFNNSGEGFVDPNIGKSTGATGANNVAVGERKSAKSAGESSKTTVSEVRESGPVGESAGVKPSLEALRHGVRNEKGDMAYFLPSFVEDPWKGLEAK
ncbi:hypothetical protein PRZ48_011107 [Zasmidium cellare]|uniref:Uncharacterized protein n=1 Tax=Zasmidium cellare TaxID=395010 RepID=A0ABR0EAU0_ZASCE|nr:hypothetical protein PRZ48_011107 [Zasmidium cellare]